MQPSSNPYSGERYNSLAARFCAPGWCVTFLPNGGGVLLQLLATPAPAWWESPLVACGFPS